MSELPGRSVRVTRKFRRSDDAAYPPHRTVTTVTTVAISHPLVSVERKKGRIAPASCHQPSTTRTD